ncbi:lasso peptide biosynthesis B2 protein [Streptomyces cavernicola]|uniref:Lasso peptide biosynthesis B2 protein n=1 Tax=Streptomyces cavernicola TaxID=3043613 RepID=A0ABT6SDP2_9ACTN|nr:lasso peptide biosynthesis B2 protein [Streptomyces sp. B-S-A6]MDI3405949.1 lasso peptide biosynthesis B2 protein [Streptomyces sp. B-S-A6]
MAVPTRTERPPLPDRLGAIAALAVASALVQAAPLRCTLAVARITKRCAHRPATAEEGVRAVAARDWVSRFFPGRAACLEISLAAFLALALRGRSVDWCIGCRFDPCESHAWIEAESGPVGEPETPDRPFHVTLRI